jgi:3-oxoacyl-[acyl-carrier-protein] synthase-3
MKSVFVHGIGVATGERRLIGTLPQLARQPELLAQFEGLGFHTYRHAMECPAELAERALEETLKATPVSRAEIDVLVYATTSFEDPAFYGADLWGLCERLDLGHVTPIGVTMAECANFGSALRVARNLVLAGDARNVLLVTTDVCPDPRSRMIEGALSIMSDGAASCLLSAKLPSRLENIGLAQRTNHTVRTTDPVARQGRLIRLTTEGVQNVVTDALNSAKVQREEIRRVLTNNISRDAVRLIVSRAGFDHELSFLDTIADHGHMYSADNLLNLRSYLSCRSVRETVVTLSHGFGTWGAAVWRIQ